MAEKNQSRTPIDTIRKRPSEMTPVARDDWRRRNQEHYLLGRKLVAKAYKPLRPSWDHDHCAFCWRKFSLEEDDLKAGYTTEDEYYWVCEPCFRDFREEFKWQLITDRDA
jgi:hypothetical protein